MSKRRQGLKLPQALVDFLLEHNGALFGWDWPAYKIHGHPRQKEGLLQCIYGIKRGDSNDLEGVHAVHKRRLPAGLLAIGNDPGDNLICIGLAGERANKIYWWERTKEAAKPTFRNAFFVANSLPEFLEHLYEFEV